MKYSFGSLCLLLALIASPIQAIHAEEQTPSSAQIFNNPDEAIDFVIKNGKLFTLNDEVVGTSDALVGSRENALQEAKSHLSTQYGYVLPFKQQVMKTWFGQAMQYVATIQQFSIIDVTPDNLVSGIGSTVGYNKYSRYLMELAKKPEQKPLTAKYKEYIRGHNTDDRLSSMGTMVDLIVLHEGKECGEDLKKWIKYHKSTSVRKASYLALMNMGRSKDVEEVLQTESNPSLKDEIQKNFL
jgi:hypothetical protein